jgi:hypothetical protein
MVNGVIIGQLTALRAWHGNATLIRLERPADTAPPYGGSSRPLWRPAARALGPGPTHQVGPFLIRLGATHLIRPGPGATHQVGPFLIRLGATHDVRTLARVASCHLSLLPAISVQRHARV